MAMTNYVRGIVSAMVLVFAAVPCAEASMTPATWVTQRVIGVVPDGVVLIHLRRHVKSYFDYDASQELRVMARNGCVVRRVPVYTAVGQDTTTSGAWETKEQAGDPAAAGELLAAMAPVVARDAESVTLRDDGLWIGHDGDWYEIVTAERVKGWAALAKSPEMDDALDGLAVAGIWESIHALQDRGLTYVELAPTMTDIDVDRIAFVVPVDVRAARKLLESGIGGRAALLASQPEPKGC